MITFPFLRPVYWLSLSFQQLDLNNQFHIFSQVESVLKEYVLSYRPTTNI